ncbi:MAG: cache domain-containing protein [bacterium]|nr:cache domain-containing protein [bacterium]
MPKEKLQFYFKITLILFLVFLAIHLINEFGVFNLFYTDRLKAVAADYREKYKSFLESKINIARTVSRDEIVRSSLIQATYNNNLMDSLQHLNLYKKNFTDIRNITLFNSIYNIILTTDLENYIINKNLSKDWFLGSLSRNYYISDFIYHSRYNEYIVTLLMPIQNVVNENIGFIMVDLSVESLFKFFQANRNLVFVLEQMNRITFHYPVEHRISREKDLEKFPLSTRIRIDKETVLVVAAAKEFISLPLIVKLLLILFFILLLFFGTYFYLEKYVYAHRKQLKAITDEIVNFSKKITVSEMDKREKTSDIKQEKRVEKKPEKRPTPEKEKDFTFTE